MSFQLALLKPESHWRPPEVLPSLKGVKRISIDVETCDPELNALGPGFRRGAYVIGIALGIDGGQRYYFPIRHAGGGNMDVDQVLRWATSELNSFDGEVVGAKLYYDLDALANEGVTFASASGFHDVQIAEPLLNEWKLSYGLEGLANDYLAEGKRQDFLREVMVAHHFKNENELKNNLWQLHASDVGEYAEGDVDLPLRILPLQLQKIEEQELTGIYTIERKLQPILVAMRRHGVRVNIGKAEAAHKLLLREKENMLTLVRHYAGPAAELLSTDSLKETIADRHLDVTYTKKKGDVQIDKGFFERNKNDEFVKVLAAGRRANTLALFIEHSILARNIKGRIHCEFNQLKGDTDEMGRKRGTIARLSCTNPNLQAVAKRAGDFDNELDLDDGTVVSVIRGIFIPEEGEEWHRMDLSQIEYRLLTHYARGPGAEAARDQYRNDPTTDFHKMVARMLGVNPEDKEKRTRVKNINFGKIYNAGIDKIALMFGTSREEAERFVKMYDSRLPFVRATNIACMQAAQDRGYVKTILGRRAHFPNWEPVDYDLRARSRLKKGLPLETAQQTWPNQRLQRAFTHAAMNRIFQGGCADLLKKAIVDSYEAGINRSLGDLLITVHDENNWSVPPTKEGQEAIAAAKHIMEHAVELKVPVLVEADRGKDWGECS